jgi:hypothetical protein
MNETPKEFNLNNPGFQPGDTKAKEIRLIHARSKKSARCMSRKAKSCSNRLTNLKFKIN